MGVEVAPVIRELPPEEWERLRAFPPWNTSPSLPPADAWRFLVVEVDGVLQGYCALYTAVHWEPWVLNPEIRGHAGVVRGLIRAGLDVLAEFGVSAAFCLADDTTAPLVEHFGFTPNPQHLYVVSVADVQV